MDVFEKLHKRLLENHERLIERFGDYSIQRNEDLKSEVFNLRMWAEEPKKHLDYLAKQHRSGRLNSSVGLDRLFCLRREIARFEEELTWRLSAVECKGKFQQENTELAKEAIALMLQRIEARYELMGAVRKEVIESQGEYKSLKSKIDELKEVVYGSY
jgi:hypothetical protein